MCPVWLPIFLYLYVIATFHILCQDLNPRPLGCMPSPLTPRPKLLAQRKPIYKIALLFAEMITTKPKSIYLSNLCSFV